MADAVAGRGAGLEIGKERRLFVASDSSVKPGITGQLPRAHSTRKNLHS